MSHFTVLVIGDDIESQLAPFAEDIEMPRYVSGEVSENDKQSFIDYYTKPNDSDNKQDLKANAKLSLEDLYVKCGDKWNGSSWRFKEDGLIVDTSTYNPKSKWDWYQVGGRWDGFLTTKTGKSVNSGTVKELDFVTPREKAREDGLKRFDEIIKLFGGPVPQPKIKWSSIVAMEDVDWDKRREIYNNQEALVTINKLKDENRDLMGIFFDGSDFDCTREEYGDRCYNSALSTFAVLNRGEWIAKGEMGWFGCSTDDLTQGDWNTKVNELIESLPEDTVLTVVDCHI